MQSITRGVESMRFEYRSCGNTLEYLKSFDGGWESIYLDDGLLIHGMYTLNGVWHMHLVAPTCEVEL